MTRATTRWYSSQTITCEMWHWCSIFLLSLTDIHNYIQKTSNKKKDSGIIPIMLTEENKGKVEQSQQTAGACLQNPITADKVKAIFTLFFKDPWKSECSLSHWAPEPESERITWELEHVRPCKYAKTNWIHHFFPSRSIGIALAVIWQSPTERGMRGQDGGQEQ